MPNGDSAPDVQTVLADENFKSLPLIEKHKVLTKVDPNYAGLPDRERAHALSVIHYGPEAVDPNPPEGSSLWRTVKGIGRGLNNAVEGTYQTIIHPINTASGIATQFEEMPGKIKEASKEPNTTGRLAGYGAAVPVLGPFGKELGERAASGDVAGAVSEGVTSVAAPFAGAKLAGKVANLTPSEGVRSTGRAIAHDVAKKYVGTTVANKILPPPPEPSMREVATKNAAQKLEQRRADEEAGLRRPQKEIEAERAAKAKNAAYQKDAEEHMAIQKRADDAEAAARKAEKAVKNSKVQGKEHEALVKSARDAAREEDFTKAELKKSQAKVDAMPPGARPTATEQFLTNLTKKSVLTPEEDAQGQRYFGERWKLKQNEGPVGRIARLLGVVRAGRKAVGMEDTSFGPMTPPPEPSASSGRNPAVSPSALEESSAQLRRRFDPEGRLTDEEVAAKARRAQRRTLEDKLGITQPVGGE